MRHVRMHLSANQRFDGDGMAIGRADSLIDHYKKRKLQRDVMNALDFSILSDHDGTGDRSEDST